MKDEFLFSLYKSMLRIRLFELKLAELTTEPKQIVNPCHLCIGQEAIAVGVMAALEKEDYVFSHHRSHGHLLARGLEMKRLMAELYCKVTGVSHGKGGSMHSSFPEGNFMGLTASVGGTIPLTVGTALASKIKHEQRVSVSIFGDGATSEGVFYESLNFASLKKLPVIFICENNLYSTHMPIKDYLANDEIWKHAASFNMNGRHIDGNDVTIVYEEVLKARQDALEGKPSLLECLTYRHRGHVGPSFDLDLGLRSPNEVEVWLTRDPLKRLEKALLDNGTLTEGSLFSMEHELNQEIAEAVEYAKRSPYPKNLMEDVFT